MTTPMDEGPSGLERASWVFSIIAGFVGIFTLLSVMVAINEITLERKTIEAAKDKKVVGRWHSVVTRGDGIGIKSSATVPSVSLPSLITEGKTMAPDILISPRQTPVQSGWANFLEVLGLKPNDFLEPKSTAPFSTERETELVEKRLPMRWSFPEFVCICSILGLQQRTRDGAEEQIRSGFTGTPLAFPCRWSGPVGTLIMRETTAGIVASFRPNTVERSPLPQLVDTSWAVECDPKGRALIAAHCLPMGDGRALQLGFKDGWDSGVDPEHAKRLWVVEEEEIYHVVESSLLQAWGLDCQSIIFVKFRLVHENAPIEDTFSMGRYIVTRTVLPLIRGALICLHPDGYIFTAHARLDIQLSSLWRHSYGAGEDLLHFAAQAAWPTTRPAPASTTSRPAQVLQCALWVLQALRGRAETEEAFRMLDLTIRDCQTIAKLDKLLRDIIGDGDGGQQLRWAMICSPPLVQALVGGIRYSSLDEILKARATITGEHFQSQDLLGPHRHHIPSPLVTQDVSPQYTYTGDQVLAAVVSFILTGAWLMTSFPNNVCYEALCVPESVLLI